MSVRYVRTPFAAVAVEFAAQAAPATQARRKRAAPAPKPAPQAREPARTMWAGRPLALANGHAVALRKRGDQLWVGVRRRGDLPVEWHLAEVVMSAAQAARWAAKGEFQ